MNFIKNILRKYSFAYILSRIDYHYGFGALERILNINWFNPLYTIYFNFRCFPLRQAIHFPVFIYGYPKLFNLSGQMKIYNSIHTGMIKLNQTRILAPSNTNLQSEINNQGVIIFKGNGFIGTGNKIVVAPNKVLEFGEDIVISNFCNIACYSGIKIGNHTRVAHRSQILDTNYHYIANYAKKIIPPKEHPIRIGNGCWICNTTTITGGTIIPDYTIVSSNSLANKDYSNIPNDSIIGGIPAKLIASGFRRVENVDMEKEVSDFYKENPNSLYQIHKVETPSTFSMR